MACHIKNYVGMPSSIVVKLRSCAVARVEPHKVWSSLND